MNARKVSHNDIVVSYPKDAEGCVPEAETYTIFTPNQMSSEDSFVEYRMTTMHLEGKSKTVCERLRELTEGDFAYSTLEDKEAYVMPRNIARVEWREALAAAERRGMVKNVYLLFFLAPILLILIVAPAAALGQRFVVSELTTRLAPVIAIAYVLCIWAIARYVKSPAIVWTKRK